MGSFFRTTHFIFFNLIHYITWTHVLPLLKYKCEPETANEKVSPAGKELFDWNIKEELGPFVDIEPDTTIEESAFPS